MLSRDRGHIAVTPFIVEWQITIDTSNENYRAHRSELLRPLGAAFQMTSKAAASQGHANSLAAKCASGQCFRSHCGCDYGDDARLFATLSNARERGYVVAACVSEKSALPAQQPGTANCHARKLEFLWHVHHRQTRLGER